MSPFQISMYQLFPEVIHIDCTSRTNKEGRPLLTITGKDSNANMFIILQALLPNEKAWCFKWFFENAFPGLVTKTSMRLTKFVITDGDLICINQLEEALVIHMPFASRGRCSWHIIDRGWAANVRLPLGGYSKKKRPPHLLGTPRKKPKPLTIADSMGRTFYRWLFSWAQPGYCLNEDEFNVSNQLFFFY